MADEQAGQEEFTGGTTPPSESQQTPPSQQSKPEDLDKLDFSTLEDLAQENEETFEYDEEGWKKEGYISEEDSAWVELMKPAFAEAKVTKQQADAIMKTIGVSTKELLKSQENEAREYQRSLGKNEDGSLRVATILTPMMRGLPPEMRKVATELANTNPSALKLMIALAEKSRSVTGSVDRTTAPIDKKASQEEFRKELENAKNRDEINEIFRKYNS